jgi:hypothetical protein
MKRRALIITPTGTNMFFDDLYDKNNHWRMRKPEADYDVCVVAFKDDFEPEPGTYDMIVRKKGLKWRLIPEIAKVIKWEDYDYIGCWDDDYCTDIQSVNASLALARQYDFRIFQQSLTSWTVFPCLENRKDVVFTETNFLEFGVPFFRNDIFHKVLEFLNDYKYEKSDWGIDKVICYYLQASAHVIHSTSIKHMRRESSYDHQDGFREMHYLMTEFFPKYMKEKYGVEYKYTDQQVVISEARMKND